MADFPEDVRDFIRDNIDSVEMLHVILLLRENPSRAWSIDELSAELRSSPNSIGWRLEHLQKRRIVGRTADAYRYVATARIDAAVQRLLECYRERRTSVIDAIFSSKPDPLQSFSDAFKLGNRRDDS